MTVRSATATPAFAAAAALVATLIAIYIVSQFLRGSVGVIAPDLASEIGLNAAEIGLLSSAFFFSFAAVQLPLGVAIDRFGAKRCLLVCIAILITGAVVFATAGSPAMLILGRMLLGLGCSSALMAPLAIYAERFPPERFATLTGLHLGIGSLGILLATAPLGWAAATIGWRATFLIVAAVALTIGLLIALVVRERGNRERAGKETFAESLAGVVTVIRTPGVGRLFLLNLAGYSSLMLVLGLWGGPYLAHVYGYGLKERGDLLLIAAVAQILGLLCWGPLDRLFRSYKIPVLLGGTVSVAALVLPAAIGALPPLGLGVWLAVLGFANGYTPAMIAHGKALFPPHLVGRGITLFNTGTIGGVFLTQAISGAVINLFPAEGGAYPLDAYRTVFALQAAFLTLACLAYATLTDPLRAEAGVRRSSAPKPQE